MSPLLKPPFFLLGAIGAVASAAAFDVWVLGNFEPKFGGPTDSFMMALRFGALASVVAVFGYVVPIFLKERKVRLQKKFYLWASAILSGVITITVLVLGIWSAAGRYIGASLGLKGMGIDIVGLLVVGAAVGVVDVLVGNRVSRTDAT